jgi:hypothetical protein
MPEGHHRVEFLPPPGGSGVYWCQLRADAVERTRKLTVIR